MSENGRHTIMVVDDEPMVLTSLQGLLELETDFTILTFSDPAAALDYFKKFETRPTPVDLIISDYLMPGMNGIELLNEVREIDPTVTRVILTGYADKENAIRAINQARLFHYAQKPWDNLQLLVTIRNGLERRNLYRKLCSFDVTSGELDGSADKAVAATRSILQRLLEEYV